METYGIFILIKTLSAKNDNNIQNDPIEIIMMRLSFGIRPTLVRSKIINPNAPIVNIKLDAKPSIMY